MTSLATEVRIRRRIEWVDTDAAGIHHWTTVFRLVEAAETELFDRLGLAEALYGGLPRAHVTVDYRHPLHFNDRVWTTLRIDQLGTSSIRYSFAIECKELVAAEGTLVVVHVDRESGAPAPLPDHVRRRLAVSAPEPSDLHVAQPQVGGQLNESRKLGM